jgi:hypothetical protein
MSTDSGVRRLLPQGSQMQNFTFAPASFMPRENQKSTHVPFLSRIMIAPTVSPDRLTVSVDYVFVDEHNRHKRLKGRKSLRFRFCAMLIHDSDARM